ncbi:MAG: hypothetical protein AB7O98_08910 [Hyphomonadaceae bacterium]
MRLRWLPIGLGVSVLLNVGLAIGWGLQVLSEAVLYTDTGSTFERLAAERRSLTSMRAQFCPDEPAPRRDALIAWAAQQGGYPSDPFEKDGLLWLSDVAVKLDAEGRLEGVCLVEAWGLANDPRLADEEEAGVNCPLDPLCGAHP